MKGHRYWGYIGATGSGLGDNSANLLVEQLKLHKCEALAWPRHTSPVLQRSGQTLQQTVSVSLSSFLSPFLSLFLLLPSWVLQIVFQPQSSTRLLKSCASNLLTWLNVNFYMNYDCLSSLHALYLHHHHHCHDDHHGEYFCLWELPTGDCKWTFCCVLLLIYCLEIFFGFTCAQDSSAKGFPCPLPLLFLFLWQTLKFWHSSSLLTNLY